MSLTAVAPIRRRSTFRSLQRPDVRVKRGPVRVSYVGTGGSSGEVFEVGYAISRRCGTAMTRNRLRRRMRALLRQAVAGEPGGRGRGAAIAPGAYLIGTDPAAAALGHRDLASCVEAALHAVADAVAEASNDGPPTAAGGPR